MYALVLTMALVVAVSIGLHVGVGASRSAIVLPLAALAGVALAVLAIARFEAFVIVCLAIRASLDSTKLGSSGSIIEPAGALAVLLILTAGLWLSARRRSSETAPPSPMRGPALAFLGAGLVSAIGSAQAGTSLFECARIAAVVAMLLVLEAILLDRRRIRHLLTAVYLSALLPLAMAVLQARQGAGFQAGGFSRMVGTFLHPNPFAIYLSLLIVMGVALLPHLTGGVRWGLVVLLLGCGWSLLLTYTRAGWIATVVGLLVVGMLQNRALIAYVMIGVMVAVVATPSVTGRFSDVGQQRHVSGTPANSLVWRFEYWGEALSLAREYPLTGIGLKMTQAQTDEAKAPHNDFIRAFVETGVVGLAAYLGLLTAFARTARQSLSRARPGFERGLAVGFVGSLVAFVLLSAVSNVISQVVILWYFVAFAASAAAVGSGRDVPSVTATSPRVVSPTP